MKTILTLILIAIAATAQADQKWIHVDTPTKVPEVRTGSSPFEIYPDAFDPNDGTPFGPSEPTMFLPVTVEATPSFDPILEKLVAYATIGTDQNGQPKSYSGKYVSPDWVQGYTVETTTLAEAQAAQLAALQEDYFAELNSGYTAGPFTFPFTESFYQQLCMRARSLNELVTAGVENGGVAAKRKITFSDINGKEVALENANLQFHCMAYTKEYLVIFEKEVAARAAIGAAATPAAVAAITWTF